MKDMANRFKVQLNPRGRSKSEVQKNLGNDQEDAVKRHKFKEEFEASGQKKGIKETLIILTCWHCLFRGQISALGSHENVSLLA